MRRPTSINSSSRGDSWSRPRSGSMGERGMHDADKTFYGNGLPYLKVGPLKGSLIVIEGTDGVGRSTQITELTHWLEVRGYGVVNTGWTRSPLLADTINEAKAGHELNVTTFSLLYAADFADRL